jgi:molybdate transport system permease protein
MARWAGLAYALGGRPLAFLYRPGGGSFISPAFVVQPLQDAFAAVGAPPAGSRRDPARGAAGPFPHGHRAAGARRVLPPPVLGPHTLGEFGVVLMIGGNIPGETQVVSIAVYDHVESLQYAHAHWLSGGLLLLSFVLLVAVYALNRRLRLLRA